MGDVVNLRIARKRAKRTQEKNEAAARRLAHGRAKAERTLVKSRSDKAGNDLARHRIETEDGP
jgi:Domain of unknown function (DUF4169)